MFRVGMLVCGVWCNIVRDAGGGGVREWQTCCCFDMTRLMRRCLPGGICMTRLLMLCVLYVLHVLYTPCSMRCMCCMRCVAWDVCALCASCVVYTVLHEMYVLYALHVLCVLHVLHVLYAFQCVPCRCVCSSIFPNVFYLFLPLLA